MMQMLVADSGAHQRPENFRQKQVRNRAQLVSRCRVARHVNPQTAQLLNQTPHFGAVGGDFLGDFSSADDDGSVLHQQAHDAAESEIGRLGLVGWRNSCPRSVLTNCAYLGDAEIMRELQRNNNRLFRPEPLACSYPQPEESVSAEPPR